MIFTFVILTGVEEPAPSEAEGTPYFLYRLALRKGVSISTAAAQIESLVRR